MLSAKVWKSIASDIRRAPRGDRRSFAQRLPWKSPNGRRVGVDCRVQDLVRARLLSRDEREEHHGATTQEPFKFLATGVE